jgi:hypothetical protein
LPEVSPAQSSVENNFNIKAGLGISRVYLRSSLIPTSHKREDESENSGYGFNTSFGYKWNTFEVLIGSDVLFGKLKDMTFLVNSAEIRGDGSFRIFSVSPILRYYTPYTIYSRWNFFVGAGPTWSLHTFIIDNNLNGTDFNNKKRINFENRGASINIGFEEVVPYKEMHPTYIELGYSYMRSKQVFIVDASDLQDAKTLSRGNSKDFYGHYIALRFGITLF